MIVDHHHRVLLILGGAVEAMEAIAVDVTFSEGKANLGDTILHVRPDDAVQNQRAAAVRAFREIVAPCVEQNADGAIEIVNSSDADGTQYCLVVRRRESGRIRDILAFISRCVDVTEAKAKVARLRLMLDADEPSRYN